MRADRVTKETSTNVAIAPRNPITSRLLLMLMATNTPSSMIGIVTTAALSTGFDDTVADTEEFIAKK